MTLQGDPAALGWIDAVILGVVEGLTEFLPVSSTGHLLVAHHLLGHPPEVIALFAIPIQLGAISAIAFLFRDRLVRAARGLAAGERRTNLLVAIAVAAVPATVLGLLFEDAIEARFYGPLTIAWATLIGGLVLIALESWLRRRPPARPLESLTLDAAFAIGLCQCLALIPGTSRSGATILGALLLGFTRPASAEFSFLVGLPILYGAGLLKLVKSRDAVFGPHGALLALALLVAFLSALFVVKPFVRYLERHTLLPFAWYRLAAGGALLWACLAGWVR